MLIIILYNNLHSKDIQVTFKCFQNTEGLFNVDKTELKGGETQLKSTPFTQMLFFRQSLDCKNRPQINDFREILRKVRGNKFYVNVMYHTQLSLHSSFTHS